MDSPFITPGIRNPHIYAADKAPLHDNDDVIGIEIERKARAYLVSAFAGFQHHVVNDILLGQPISVTHCDLHNCTRVFTGPKGDQPLELGYPGQMLYLFVQSLVPAVLASMITFSETVIYTTYAAAPRIWDLSPLVDQQTGGPLNPGAPALPYAQFSFVRTTWAEWKRAHPNPDVYVGEDAN